MSLELRTVAWFDPDDGSPVPDRPETCELAGWVTGKLFRLLDDWCERMQSGVPLTGGTGYRCFPGRPTLVRTPDIAVVPGATSAFIPSCGDSPHVPLLVVEVVSPRELVVDLHQQIGDFFAAGTRLVWVVSPKLRCVDIHRPDGTGLLLRDPAELSGENVLPGFAVPLAAFLPRVPAA